jgi:hypothetical protein
MYKSVSLGVEAALGRVWVIRALVSSTTGVRQRFSYLRSGFVIAMGVVGFTFQSFLVYPVGAAILGIQGRDANEDWDVLPDVVYTTIVLLFCNRSLHALLE